jgi:hypothetical protein
MKIILNEQKFFASFLQKRRILSLFFSEEKYQKTFINLAHPGDREPAL